MAGGQSRLRGDLAQLAEQFAQWRRTHARRARIPDWLWEWAAEAAAQHGLSRTATTLKLGYYDLKKRLSERGTVSPKMASPSFVELRPLPTSNAFVCTIELEKPTGARMRIKLKGASAAELVAVSHSFWESA